MLHLLFLVFICDPQALKYFCLFSRIDPKNITKFLWNINPIFFFFFFFFLDTEVQCGDPMSVKDGFIEVSNFKGKYVFGSLATYHCNPGFILWGNASRLCTEEGIWTGVKPQCKPITCGQPPEVSNTRFQLMNGSTSWQSLAKYTCKSGHSMVYEKSRFL